ncbi:MAG: hypothetical protein V1746_01125 [bacterium]
MKKVTTLALAVLLSPLAASALRADDFGFQLSLINPFKTGFYYHDDGPRYYRYPSRYYYRYPHRTYSYYPYYPYGYYYHYRNTRYSDSWYH